MFTLQIFLEQKKMLKTGLNIAQFKKHVSIIENETKEYMKRWGDSGETSTSKRSHKRRGVNAGFFRRLKNLSSASFVLNPFK